MSAGHTMTSVAILLATATAQAGQEGAGPATPAVPRITDVDSLVRAMTLDEKLGLLSGATDPAGMAGAGYVPGVPRLGIPPLRLADGPAGMRTTLPATALPAPVLLAATFDPALAHAFGAVIGREGRARGQDVLLSPIGGDVTAALLLGAARGDTPALPGDGGASRPTSDGYELVWADEFDRPGLPDSTRWAYDVGDGCPRLCGWGNDELQSYTERRAENARVENGHLVIEARKEPMGTRGYTSARLVTKGKADWTYGRLEIRARLPSGRGTWPALWMLPTDTAYGGWPASGEIDIMEHVGFAPDSIHASVHTTAYNHLARTQRTSRIAVPDCERAFHVYAIEWTPERIDFFVDDTRYHSFANQGTGPDAWPFDRPFHLILNVAVGGMWGGMRGVDDAIWPQRMAVDYVRVFQRP